MGKKAGGKDGKELPKGQRPITQFFIKKASSSTNQTNPNAATPSQGQANLTQSNLVAPIPGTSTVRKKRVTNKYENVHVGDEVEYIQGPMPKQYNVLDVITLCSDSELSPPCKTSSSTTDQENENVPDGLGSDRNPIDSVHQEVLREPKSSSSILITESDHENQPIHPEFSSVSIIEQNLEELIAEQPSKPIAGTSKGLRNQKKRKSRDEDEDFVLSSDTDVSEDELVPSTRRIKRPIKPTRKNISKRKKINENSEILYIGTTQRPILNSNLSSQPVPDSNSEKLTSPKNLSTAEQKLNSDTVDDISMLVDSNLNDVDINASGNLSYQNSEAFALKGSCISSPSSSISTVVITPPDVSIMQTQPRQIVNHNSLRPSINNGIMEGEKSDIQLSPACSPVVTRKNKINSPKPKANYFSPVRHVRHSSPIKKTASSSSSSPKSSPTPTRQFTTPISHHDVGPSVRSSVKKSLNFDPNPSLNPIASSASFGQTDQSQKHFEPYYLETFQLVLDSVPKDYNHLFNEAENLLIQSFQVLSTQAKLLYVRLFNRKWEWKQACNIKYPKIAPDLDPYFQELHKSKLLLELKDVCISVEELDNVLNALTSPQVSALAKQMKLNPSSKTKDGFKSAIFAMIQSQRTLHGSGLKAVTKQIFTLVGPTYRVSEESKSLFSRMFLLHSPPNYWDDEADQSANISLLHLLTKTEKMVYPEYTLNKTTHVYQRREDILRFYEAWKIYSEVQSLVEMKSWEQLKNIAESILLQMKEILENPEINNFDNLLPNFLRIYTAGSLLTKILSVAVEAFQKTKEFKRANEIMEFLLDQDFYFPNYRGRWHERIIINSKHLKVAETNIMTRIGKALEDSRVLDAERLDFTERFQKSKELSSRVKKPKTRAKRGRAKRKHIKNDDSDSASETEAETESNELLLNQDLPEEMMLILKHSIKERFIEGEQMSVSSERNFGKSVFIGSGNTATGNTVHNVESFAIHYYISQENFKHGLHGEGSIPVTIYGLLFWAVIYDDTIEDSFHSPFQAFPLDFLFPDFYLRRENFIKEVLENLRYHSTQDDVLDLLERNWNNNFGKMSIVNWTIFSGIEQVQDLVLSMGFKLVADICERLAQNFRYYRSGFPDITLWNQNTGKCMFVEVKGPGDQLSKKQKLWLEYLSSVGANVEVCRVKSVSNKRIRT